MCTQVFVLDTMLTAVMHVRTALIGSRFTDVVSMRRARQRLVAEILWALPLIKYRSFTE